ncbi:MAG: hypothetical protein E7415_04030 [Ruminococcaceae bacterium]|nr:hypothetical protein [Oscillospiraceae bacterium]
MVKKLLKWVGVFVFLLAVAGISWITSYYVTTKANKSAYTEDNSSYAVFAEEHAENTPKKANKISFEYYIVRLEGNLLNVYACADNSEEFLCSEEIVTSNLTKTDIEFLEQGTVLYTTGQLTQFMENFVS